MRPVRIARQKHVTLLMARAGGPKALAAIVGSPDTHLIAISGGKKQMGDRLARKIEAACNRAFHLGRDPGWLDIIPQTDDAPAESTHTGVALDHGLSLSPFDTPQHILSGDMVGLKTLPQRFTYDVPDDALVPQTPRGTRLIFDTLATPMPGHGVLVQDSTGARYVRRYIPGTAGRWSAGSRNDAYSTLESERDGLRVLAVATGRLDGAV